MSRSASVRASSAPGSASERSRPSRASATVASRCGDGAWSSTGRIVPEPGPPWAGDSVTPPPYGFLMTTAVRHLPPPAEAVTVEGDRVAIERLETADADLAALLTAASAEARADLVRRALAVGARGLATMGVGIDVAAVNDQVRQTVDAAI